MRIFFFVLLVSLNHTKQLIINTINIFIGLYRRKSTLVTAIVIGFVWRMTSLLKTFYTQVMGGKIVPKSCQNCLKKLPLNRFTSDPFVLSNLFQTQSELICIRLEILETILVFYLSIRTISDQKLTFFAYLSIFILRYCFDFCNGLSLN